jgi:probable HAF family extracellular repeat protein
MKRIATLMIASSLLAAFALAQPGNPRYTAIDLGPVGNSPGAPYGIAANGLVAGAAATPDRTAVHAVLSYRGLTFDLGKAGVGRPNSAAFGVNDQGQVVGAADTMSTNGADDFCGFNAEGFTSKTACVPFLWQNGVMKTLSTLGGANGVANKINNRGQAVGFAETGTSDPSCQVAQFKPVVWESGGVRQLPISVPGSSDTYGSAYAINDNGQVVGSSGVCGAFNPPAQTHMVLNHALLWDRNGVQNLGNLGGAGGLGGNHACAVNNHGQVAGHSDLTGNTAFHAFQWTEAGGMVDLGTLPADAMSLANGINDKGEVVGASIAPGFSAFAAVRWGRDGIADLNKLVTVNPAGLYLMIADWVNSSGEIVGLGVAADGLHGYLATPNRAEYLSSDLPNVARPLVTGRDRDAVIRRLGIRLPDPKLEPLPGPRSPPLGPATFR